MSDKIKGEKLDIRNIKKKGETDRPWRTYYNLFPPLLFVEQNKGYYSPFVSRKWLSILQLTSKNSSTSEVQFLKRK